MGRQSDRGFFLHSARLIDATVMERQVRWINQASAAPVACGILVVLTLARPTVAAESTDSMPQPVERASADDCAIFVEVGKNQMAWGAVAPDFAFYAEFDRSGGGTYLVDCPWKALGVAEPLGPSQQPEKGFFITRPEYNGDEATVSIQYSISGQLVDGKKARPFIRRSKCSLAKKDDRWQIVACKLEMTS